jgi:hypothetical protein
MTTDDSGSARRESLRLVWLCLHRRGLVTVNQFCGIMGQKKDANCDNVMLAVFTNLMTRTAASLTP